MSVKSEWVEVTRYVLAEKAALGETITYGALYDRLRAVNFPSWPSRKNGHSWMNTYLSPILSDIGGLCRINEEPLLSALVRNQDTGQVGFGYPTSVLRRYDYTPERFILHAQVETGKCFRHFGTPQ